MTANAGTDHTLDRLDATVCRIGNDLSGDSDDD